MKTKERRNERQADTKDLMVPQTAGKTWLENPKK